MATDCARPNDCAEANAERNSPSKNTEVNSLNLLADAGKCTTTSSEARCEGTPALDSILGNRDMVPPNVQIADSSLLKFDLATASDDMKDLGTAARDFAEHRNSVDSGAYMTDVRDTLKDLREDFRNIEHDFADSGLDSNGRIGHAMHEAFRELRHSVRDLIAGGKHHGDGAPSSSGNAGSPATGGDSGSPATGGDGGSPAKGGDSGSPATGGDSGHHGIPNVHDGPGSGGSDVVPKSGDDRQSGGSDVVPETGDGTIFSPLPTDNTNGGPPPEAAALGYTSLTFNSNFDSAQNGFVPFTFYGANAVNPGDVVQAGDHLVLKGDNSGYGGGLTTAQPADNAQGFTGKAFGGGGYWEATLSFDPNAEQKGNAWPAFWALPINDLTGKDAGNRIRTEIDTFEYDTQGSGKNTYGGAVHDWLADGGHISNGGDNSQFNNFLINAPENVDWTQPHKFGTLWQPAKDGKEGYLQMFFDGKPTGDKVTWDGPNSPFGNTDNDQYALILGTGQDWPMNVYNVQVWQDPNTENNAGE
jgi:hypothetical protein